MFKGREAKLNRAIFQVLADHGPQVIYDIHKKVRTRRDFAHTRYANLNLRVRLLGRKGYVKSIGFRKTKAGFNASVYDITNIAYLAFLLEAIGIETVALGLSEITTQLLLIDILPLLKPRCVSTLS